MKSKILMIPPPVWTAFYLSLALIWHLKLPQYRLSVFHNYWLGLSLITFGIIVIIVSIFLFFREKTEILPMSKKNSRLLTRGPYLYSRNPIYLGDIFITLGIAFIMESLPFYLVPLAIFFTIDRIFIPYEEEKMERQFGKEYLDYKKRVRRWI